MTLPMQYVDPQFITKRQRHLYLTTKGHSSNEHYNVIDPYGNLLFTTLRKTLSLSNRHILKYKGTNTGQFRIKRDSILQETYYVGTMDDLKRFKLNLTKFSSSSSYVDINILSNFNGKERIIGQVSGNLEQMLFGIEINHEVVASISPLSILPSESNDSGFHVVIGEGVDSAFILLIAIALEQIIFGQNPKLKGIFH